MFPHSDIWDIDEKSGNVTLYKGSLFTTGSKGRAGTPVPGTTSVPSTSSVGASGIALDCSKGNWFQLTLSANVGAGLITSTNAVLGMEITVEIINGASAYTCGKAGFTGFKFAGGAYTTTASANAIDIITFIFDGTNFQEVCRSLANA